MGGDPRKPRYNWHNRFNFNPHLRMGGDVMFTLGLVTTKLYFNPHLRMGGDW